MDGGGGRGQPLYEACRAVLNAVNQLLLVQTRCLAEQQVAALRLLSFPINLNVGMDLLRLMNRLVGRAIRRGGCTHVQFIMHLMCLLHC